MTSKQARSGDRCTIVAGEHKGANGTLGQYNRSDTVIMDSKGLLHPIRKGWRVQVDGGSYVIVDRDDFALDGEEGFSDA